MRLKLFFIICLISLSTLAQQPNAEAFDKALNSLELNKQSLASFLKDKTTFNKNGNYRFSPSEKFSDITQHIKDGKRLIETQDISDIYIFSTDGDHSYGAFDINNDILWGRLYFRFKINGNEISDLLIADWGRDDISKGLLIFGDASVKNYQRPKLPFMKMAFGGGIIEIFALFAAFITAILTLKNTLTKKSIYLASILAQFQLMLVFLGIYGVAGIISIFASIGSSAAFRIIPVYFTSLQDLMLNFFIAAFVLLTIIMLKLRPYKYLKFWMFSNIIVIPSVVLGLLHYIQVIIFSR